jgi:hypothetical protein
MIENSCESSVHCLFFCTIINRTVGKSGRGEFLTSCALRHRNSIPVRLIKKREMRLSRLVFLHKVTENSGQSCCDNLFHTMEVQQFIYVDENKIEDDFICSICLDPITGPTQHGCGNMFCRNCIIPLKDCPICRKVSRNQLTEVTLKVVLNHLNSLKVMCPNCEEQMPRISFPKHPSRCPRRKISIKEKVQVLNYLDVILNQYPSN